MHPHSAMDWTEPKPLPVNEAEATKLDIFRDIAQTLAELPDLKASLQSALNLLVTRSPVAIAGGMIVVFGEQGGDVEVHVSVGPPSARRNGASPPSGVTGRVVQSGRPVVVSFKQRAGGARSAAAAAAAALPDPQALTHIAAPITLDGLVAGMVGVDYLFEPDRDLYRSMKYVDLLASMVAIAVAGHRRLEAKRLAPDESSEPRVRGQEPFDFPRLVGTSDPLGQVQAQVAQVASSNTTVLLRGESGTGKGLIAHAIHHNSPRGRKPFVTINCASIPPDLLESELFGHEKGAFTGALAAKKGRLEVASGGTVFFDEIGELGMAVQIKLLRVLQEREFERLGGTQTIPVDIRVLAATNKNLEKAIAAGEFREDLYYRLNVFSIFVPPLRDRKADVLLLADHFLEKFAREHGKTIRRISTPAIDMLASYHWPGNVRELSNAIERAVVVCDGGVLHSHHLPPTLQTAESSETMANLSLQEMVEAVEKDALKDALKTARGNRTTAARLLRTTRRILIYKIRNYGIDWRRYLAK
jgi:Nif-specific regulatory protein